MKHTENDLWGRIERAAGHFSDQRSLFYYARGKMALDPAYPLLARLLMESPGTVWDLGCGAGIFAAYLRESGVTASIFGVDLAEEKVGLARERVAGAYAEMDFVVADLALWVLESDLALEGAVVMLDALHYFSAERQAEILRGLAARMKPGARLYLRNGVRDAGWRFACTLAEEGFVRLSRWITGGDCQFPTRRFVEETLREAGLAVVTVPLWGKTPFSSMLFTAARPG